ncbi:MAG: MOSC domain-containing protein [Actinomycetota bacterium]
MPDGRVAAIYIGPEEAGPLDAVAEVRAVAGAGLEGDRYFVGRGNKSDRPSPGRQVTLIEREAIEAAARDHGVVLALGDPRRNIVTEHVALNHLVGREFAVGEARFRGVKLCEPCSYVAKLIGDKRVVKALIHRGGLNAEIVTSGTVRVGDRVAAAAPPPTG